MEFFQTMKKLIFMLLAMISFVASGQNIGPWEEVPTFSLPSVDKLVPFGNHAYIHAYSPPNRNGNKHFVLNLSNGLSRTLTIDACLRGGTIKEMFSSNGELYSIATKGDSAYLVKISETGVCIGSTFLMNLRTNGAYLVLKGTPYIQNNKVIQVVQKVPNATWQDTLGVIQFNLSNNQLQFKLFPQFEESRSYEISKDTDNSLFIQKHMMNPNTFLFSRNLFLYNDQTMNFDLLSSNVGNYTNTIFWDNKVFGYNPNIHEVARLEANGSWTVISSSLPAGLITQNLYTFDNQLILQTQTGFYTLNSNTSSWNRLNWEAPRLNMGKALKISDKIFALAYYEIFQMLNNQWHSYSFSGDLNDNRGTVKYFGDYMLFRERFISYDRGSSWQDLYRLFNTNVNNFIGGLGWLTPSLWYGYHPRTYEITASSDQGRTWQPINNRIVGLSNPNHMALIKNYSFKNTDTAYAIYRNSNLQMAISPDRGITWYEDIGFSQQLVNIPNIVPSYIDLCFENNAIYLALNGDLFKSSSRREPFVKIYDNSDSLYYFTKVHVSGDTILLTSQPTGNYNNLCVVSIDGGRTFNNIVLPSTNGRTEWAIRQGQIWCLNDYKLYISDDLGRSLQRFYTPIDDQQYLFGIIGIYSFKVTDSLLFIHGQKTFTSRLPQGRVVSLAAEIQAPKEQLSLYPNPANERVFVKGLSSSFDYEILNSLGQIMQSGSSEGDILISTLPAGTYLLRTNQNSQTLTQRFVKL